MQKNSKHGPPLPHSRSLQCIFSPLPFLLPSTHTKREVQGKKHSDREITGGLLLSWGGMWVSWYAIGLGNCPDGGIPGAAHSPVFLQSLGNSIIYTLYTKFSKTIRHLGPYCPSLIWLVSCDRSPLSPVPFVFACLKCCKPSVHSKPTDTCNWLDTAINENTSEASGVSVCESWPPYLLSFLAKRGVIFCPWAQGLLAIPSNIGQVVSNSSKRGIFLLGGVCR